VLLARLASDDPDHPRLAVSMEVRQAVRAAMAAHPAASAYVLHVLVSPDVPIDDDCLALWGWFTRFDPLSDVMPAGRTQAGNRLLLTPPICIDATWKKGYRLPVAFDPERQRRVMGAWGEYGLP
jgi:3-polyprenyl-4-hydroxybenzoate decarboxylase